jgi:hypothetical protein
MTAEFFQHTVKAFESDEYEIHMIDLKMTP